MLYIYIRGRSRSRSSCQVDHLRSLFPAFSGQRQRSPESPARPPETGCWRCQRGQDHHPDLKGPTARPSFGGSWEGSVWLTRCSSGIIPGDPKRFPHVALPKRTYLLGIPATHTSSTACASPLSPSLAQLTDRGSSHRLGSIGCRLLGSGRAVAGRAPPSTARHSSARWSCILFLPGDPLCRLPLKVTLRRSDCLGCLDPSRLTSRPHLTSAKSESSHPLPWLAGQ